MCKIKHLNPPPNHDKFWENEVMKRLGKRYEDCTYAELAKIFGRTKCAIISRVHILRIAVRMAPYTDEISPVMISKRSATAKIRLQTKEGKAQFEAARSKNSTPEALAKRSASMKASWARKKASK